MRSPVTVCLVARNNGSYLRETLDSIIGQTYPNFDVFIADEDSADDSLAIAQEYADRDSRFKVFCNQERLGRNKALKLLIKQSDSRLIKCLNPGDTLDFNALDEMGRIFERYPQVGIVSCGYRCVTAEGAFIKSVRVDHPNTILEGTAVIKEALLEAHSVIGPLSATMFRRDNVFQSIDDRYVAGSDLALWTSLLAYRSSYALDVELVSVRYFDELAQDNRLKESLVKLADLTKLFSSTSAAAGLASLSIGKRSDMFDKTLDQVGSSMVRAGNCDLALSLRAAEILFDDLTPEEIADCLESLTHLWINRSQRAQEHQRDLVGQKELESIEQEVEELELVRKKILRSATWKLSTKVQSVRRTLTGRETEPFSSFEPEIAQEASLDRIINQNQISEPTKDLVAVTVIVPLWDSWPLPIKNLQRLSQQTLESLEIVLLTDKEIPEELLADFRTSGKSVRLERCSQSVEAVEKTIESAQGKYICFWKADDQVTLTYLEKALFLAEHFGESLIAPARRQSSQKQRNGKHQWSVLPPAAQRNPQDGLASFAYHPYLVFKKHLLNEDYLDLGQANVSIECC